MSGEPDVAELVLYGRDGCCLCERLEGMIRQALRGRRASILLRNVDTDPRWRSSYGLRIPVLTRGTRVILEGRPDEATVQAALADI